MKIFKLIIVTAIALAVAGCGSTFKNRNRHYLEAKSIPALRIPPGISSDKFDNRYPVSERQDPAASKEVSLLPPGLDSAN